MPTKNRTDARPHPDTSNRKVRKSINSGNQTRHAMREWIATMLELVGICVWPETDCARADQKRRRRVFLRLAISLCVLAVVLLLAYFR